MTISNVCTVTVFINLGQIIIWQRFGRPAGADFFSVTAACDFEDPHLCGYSNLWNVNVNWYVGGGGVHLLHNHMPTDHTYQNKTGESKFYCTGGF